MVCGRHLGASLVVAGEGDEEGDGEGAAAAFRRRLAEGDYRALYGPGIGETVARAAADPGLDDEIGALRVTLARLLLEEADAARLATAVARLAQVAVQAARVRRSLATEEPDLIAAMLRRLDEEDEEDDEDGEGRRVEVPRAE